MLQQESVGASAFHEFGLEAWREQALCHVRLQAEIDQDATADETGKRRNSHMIEPES